VIDPVTAVLWALIIVLVLAARAYRRESGRPHPAADLRQVYYVPDRELERIRRLEEPTLTVGQLAEVAKRYGLVVTSEETGRGRVRPGAGCSDHVRPGELS
jgi:hypothetical protein